VNKFAVNDPQQICSVNIFASLFQKHRDPVLTQTQTFLSPILAISGYLCLRCLKVDHRRVFLCSSRIQKYPSIQPHTNTRIWMETPSLRFQ